MRLYQACPWATAFQSPGFVIPWLEAYGDRYRVLLLCEFSSSNELIGLLPITIESASGRATLPGAHQAEYKTWLALPSNGSSFIEQSLRLLAQEIDIGSLAFRYLAPGSPLDWIRNARELSWICESEKHPRAAIRLDDALEVADYLNKKNSSKCTRSKWNRLRRLGKVDFEHIVRASELAPIFDRLIAYYEIRQEAIHGKRAFQDDPAKKPFHLALLQDPNLLHVTVMKVGGEPVSASFGFVHRKTYSLAMSMFSPAHAYYSPVMLHFLLLVEQLHKEGFSALDLTAGTDPFKERFAGDYDSVQALSLYTHTKLWLKDKVQKQGEKLARRALHACGIAPNTARLHFQRLLRAPLRTAAGTLARAGSVLLGSLRHCGASRIYAIEKRRVAAITGPPLTSRDCLADLLAFYPAENSRARHSFLAECLRRFEDGLHSYTRVQDGRLLYCGWMIENQKPDVSSRIYPGFECPIGSAVLLGDYSDPNFEGCAWLKDTLSQALRNGASNSGTNYLFVILNADDPLCRDLRKTDGWIPVASVGDIHNQIRPDILEDTSSTSRKPPLLQDKDHALSSREA